MRSRKYTTALFSSAVRGCDRTSGGADAVGVAQNRRQPPTDHPRIGAADAVSPTSTTRHGSAWGMAAAGAPLPSTFIDTFTLESLSKLSEMAPATVPAASRLECSDDAPQATVELRLTPLMRILRRSRVLLRSALASHCLSLVFVRCFHPSPRRAARDGSGTPSALSVPQHPPHRRRGEAPCWRVASAGPPKLQPLLQRLLPP